MRLSCGFLLLENTAPTDSIRVPQLGHANCPSTIGSSTWVPQPGHLAYTARAMPPSANKTCPLSPPSLAPPQK